MAAPGNPPAGVPEPGQIPRDGSGGCPLRIDILTIFPELFEPVLSVSIPGRARAAGLVKWVVTDLRDYTTDKRRTVDDRPFGGGPGMVMLCQPIADAVRAVEALDPRPAERLYMSPQGEVLKQPAVESFAAAGRLLVLAGHYEGVDERVLQAFGFREVSVGDYVLSGGELPALTLVDAVCRLLPGALGHADSAAEDSFSPRGPAGERLLDCPHYTRPRAWEGRAVPEVLFGGDHGAVDRWRAEQMLLRTRDRRPDLLGSQDGCEQA